MRSLRYWFWSTSLVLGTALCIVVVVGLNLWLCVEGPSFLQTSANQEHARSVEAWGEPLQATKISQSAVRFDDSGPIRQVCYRYTNKYGDSRAICGDIRQAGRHQEHGHRLGAVPHRQHLAGQHHSARHHAGG